jgi:hypothetical protein
MSAVVDGCGRPFCCSLADREDVTIQIVPYAPQIHAHYLTDRAEFHITKRMLLELCCHGCGTALHVIHEDPSNDITIKPRDMFIRKHRECANFGFDAWCPNIRSSVTQIDLRQVQDREELIRIMT